MSTHTLRPWIDLVKLHPDGEAGALTETVLTKLVAKWRALVDRRLAADEGTLFDARRP